MKKSSKILRLFDIVLSLLGLIIFSPFFIIVAVLIRTESRGGVIFRQERIGKSGKAFTIYKFRTMRLNSKNDILITTERDARITNTGRLLRRMKFDEIPQLLNVLKGDMSVVGPRPEVRKYVEKYTREQKIILSIKPGITDQASIYFRNEEKILRDQDDPDRFYEQVIIPKKINLNMEFIYNQNLITYFTIILKTIYSLFHFSGKDKNNFEVD